MPPHAPPPLFWHHRACPTMPLPPVCTHLVQAQLSRQAVLILITTHTAAGFGALTGQLQGNRTLGVLLRGDTAQGSGHREQGTGLRGVGLLGYSYGGDRAQGSGHRGQGRVQARGTPTGGRGSGSGFRRIWVP